MNSEEIENEHNGLESDIFEGMSDEEIEDLLEVFHEDLSERIDNLSDTILKLEENPEGEDSINAIFQEFHSIKGTGGSFGFPVLSEIAHKFESLFSDIRDKKASVTPELIDLLFDTTPILKEIIRKIRGRKDFDAVVNEIFKIIDSYDAKVSQESVKEAIPGDQIKEKGKDDIDHYEVIKLKPERIDRLIALSSELLRRNHIDSQHLSELNFLLSFLKQNTELLKDKLDSVPLSSNNGGESGKGVFDSIIDNFNRCNEGFSKLQDDCEMWIDSFANLTNDLQYEVLKTRMVIVDELFRKLKRTVRDILKQEKKKVQVRFSGGDTEIDKILMDEIKDPLTHIIRNSIDHGIEMPEERKASGKDPVASINISAAAAGNEIQIKIEDDGRGIDTEKIKKTAESKGLYKKGELNKFNRQQLINLIFKPGFSTSKEVTKISGRGVGMDVVKSNLDRIRGIILIETEPGSGTEILLKIPTTLAAIKALFFRVGIFHFYMQSISVEKIIRISPVIKRPKGRYEEVIINNTSIPYIYLGDFWSIPETEDNAGTYIIIFRSGARRMAIEVDECIDQHDVVLKPTADLLKNFNMVAGVSVLPDGKVAYVIEPSEIINKCDQMLKHIDKKKSWKLDFIDEDFSETASLEEQISYNIEDKEIKGLYLKFIKGKNHYGIPVDSIVKVFNLTDKNLALKVEEKYRSILHLKENKAQLIHRQPYSSPLNLIERTGVKSAVVIKKNKLSSLLLIDELLNIEVIDKQTVTELEKTGNNTGSIPDLVLLN
ncbi:chemotaxis protein CheA [candidate division KSB1 bacterium]